MRDSLILLAAALAAFGLSLAGSFHFDDYALFEDASMTSWSATRPLTNLTFRLNQITSGREPAGYHAVNLAIHLAAVLLLRSALSRLIPVRAAFAAALLFAVHPAAAEPVNYVFARGTLLATLLVIGSLGNWASGRHWWAVVWFAAALLAKEECVAYPIFLLLLHLSSSRNRRELAPIGVMLALSLAAGMRVLLATTDVTGSGAGFSARVGALDYLSTQGVAILRYLRLLAIPWGYAVDPDLLVEPVWIRFAAWMAVVALAALATRWLSAARPGFWLIGGLLLLLPSSSIFPADDLAADRRMYLPMIAWTAGLGLLVARMDRRAVGALACVLIAISVRYSFVWQTERRLWTEAAIRAPGKARPLLHLSRTLEDPNQALNMLERAQRLSPSDPAIASEQGRVLLSLGRTAEALAAFGRALALRPGDPAAISNRGVALAALGQIQAARRDFEQALAANPCLFDARLNLRRIGGKVPAHQCRFTPEQSAALER